MLELRRGHLASSLRDAVSWNTIYMPANTRLTSLLTTLIRFTKTAPSRFNDHDQKIIAKLTEWADIGNYSSYDACRLD